MIQAIELGAFRRNDDEHAAELRAEVPLLLGRLAAEVPGAAFELQVRTGDDGVVDAVIGVEAGGLTPELLRDVAAVLAPIAELELTTRSTETLPQAVWPLVTSSRSVLGFQQTEPNSAASVAWSIAGTRGLPDLAELVSPHAGMGIRIGLTSSGQPVNGQAGWNVELAILTSADSKPSLRLRAAVRTLYPGLEVAAQPGDSPAILRVLAEELAAAFAVPVAGEEPIPGAYVGTAAPLPVHPTKPPIVNERSIRVGSAVTLSGRRLDVTLSREERLRHIHVLGRTGTGKSSFLAGFVNEVAHSGDGALVLDPHGALVNRIIAELPEDAADRTWVIRCGDVNNPVPLNPMSVDDVVRREIAIDDICATFQYIFDKGNTGIVGPRFRERVAMGLRALATMHGMKASLLDVPAALSNRRFLHRAAQLSGDDRLRAWVANDDRNMSSNEYGEVVAWVNSKFEAFSSTTAMRGILGSGEDAIDLAAAMDLGQLVLVDLSKGDLGESATRLLGYLYLNEAWIGALQREDRWRPFTVIVDEAQSMISGSLSAMLSEGRKFGLSVLLAHQYLGQLDSDLLPAVDGNVATTVAFRGAGSDVAALRQRFGGSVEASTLMTMPDLSAITLRTAAHVTGEPYTLMVDHNQRVTTRSGPALHEFEHRLTEATVRVLVDDYREETAAAAAGKSNVITPDVPVEKAGRPAPPRPKQTAPKAAETASFLAEWLAKKQAQPKAPTAKTDDEQLPDDVPS